MSEIKCPHCGEVFKVDEQGYAAIVAQVKTAEFDKELDKRVADEKDKALKLAKLDFDSKYTKAVNDKDMEIQKLKAAAANGESEKTLAVTKAQESTRAEYEKTLEQLKEQISQNEKLIAQLTAQTKSMTTEKNLPYQWLWRKQDRNSTAKRISSGRKYPNVICRYSNSILSILCKCKSQKMNIKRR